MVVVSFLFLILYDIYVVGRYLRFCSGYFYFCFRRFCDHFAKLPLWDFMYICGLFVFILFFLIMVLHRYYSLITFLRYIFHYVYILIQICLLHSFSNIVLHIYFLPSLLSPLKLPLSPI